MTLLFHNCMADASKIDTVPPYYIIQLWAQAILGNQPESVMIF